MMAAATKPTKGVKYECRNRIELSIAQGGKMLVSPGEKLTVFNVGALTVDVLLEGVSYRIYTSALIDKIPTGDIFLI